MAFPKVKIADADGEIATVTDGKLDVNAVLSSSDNIEIGNVDIKLNGTGVSASNGAADAGTVRVTVASDSTGLLSVDDNGGSLTVDGTVTANAGSGTQAVSLASVPSHAVTNAGTFAVQAGHDITGGADGLKVVSFAGTDVVLGGDVDCKKVDIQAQTDNTGLIAVGFTGVDATEATGTGVILYAGDTYSLEISNLNLIYIDATVGGEGVRYTYYT